jgi:hypothetical protein
LFFKTLIKNLFMKKLFILVAAATMLYSCKKDENKEGVFKGAVVQVHEGKAWSWTKLDHDGAPKQLALTIDDEVLSSVPIGGEGGHGHENDYEVPLHPKAVNATLFNHIWLNWNPSGHDPENVYTLPHFDIHYYMTSIAERQAATDGVKMDNLPASDYLPPTFISPMPGVPGMGRHWIDVTSPELDPNNPQTFTQTFIYGSYDGKVTYYEPMITLEFLKNTNNFERNIPQPSKVQKTGFYPTKMKIVKHDGVTDIILEAFVHRQAS